MNTTTTTPTPAQTGGSRARTFLQRLASTLVLWALVLGALFSGVRWVSLTALAVIVMLLGGLGLAEFFALVRRCQLPSFPGWGMVAGLLLLAGTFFALAGWPSPAISLAQLGEWEAAFLACLVIVLLVRQLFAPIPGGLPAVAITLLGVVYVAWLLGFLQKIYFYPGVAGNLFVFYFILVTKFSDTGAYLVGSLLGRHKMIPRISPGKTWEGFAGALVIPTLASLLWVWLVGDRMAGMHLGHALALGLLLSVGAVTGDLVESLFKRQAGVKDSGRWFPGIGGILDLSDSLLFNAPIMYWYLRFILAPAP